MVYARCTAFRSASPQQRAAVSSKGLRSQYTRIAHLPPWIGTPLDKAGVSYRVIRWVAYGNSYVEQQERFELAMKGEYPRDQTRRLSKRKSPGPAKKSTPSPFPPR